MPRTPEKPDRLVRLLLKALKSLPPKEETYVLERLLSNAMAHESTGTLVPGSPITVLKGLDAMRRLATATKISPPGREATEAMDKVMAIIKLRVIGASPFGSHQMLPVRFSEDQYARLKGWCEKNNFSMAVVVRGLVENFLDLQERRA